MPSTSYRFGCNTKQDLDLIAWLDGFASRERTLIIKEALRLYRRNETMTTADKLERMEEQLSRVLRELVSIKRERLIIPNNGREIHKEQQMTDNELEEIRKNVLNLLK